MIHSKHTKRGFTLIEVLLSIAIIGVVLVPMFIAQATMLVRINDITRATRALLERELLLQEARVETTDGDRLVKREKAIDGKSQSVYELRAPDQKSALAKVPGILIETVSTKYTTPLKAGVPASEPLVTLLFKPERKSDDTKGSHTS